MSTQGPLRIIHCFRSPVGGIFRHVRDLAERHSQQGHAVGIVCDSSTGGAYEDALFESIRPHLALGLTRLPMRRSISPSDLSAGVKSYREIKALRPDVLHGHGAKGGAYARLAGTFLRASGYCVARFYSPHGGSLHYDPGSTKGRVFFAIERFLERMTDRLVFVCDYERDVYTRKIGAPRAACQVVYNGLRAAEFEPVRLSETAVDFLYIGMMRDLKGPDVFIDAFVEAERLSGRPLSALMVGDGDDKPRYQSSLETLGLADRVTMRPAMPAREAFAMARTVIVPSRAEAMPYIVLEAVASSKPVIASRVGGIPEILGKDSAALVEPGNARALGATMSVAIVDPFSLDAEMPDAAQFAQRFSVETMADGVMSAYGTALDEGNARGLKRFPSSLS
ncbi:glycosyltransferase family 4 protein [Rhizobium sp. EC-SD404]|uniref:glycosyltransferase family 4 protein n=1 Tax=Rhizobium sp. EC-SD404 TaxID=2038389 RepID=UPI0012590FB0|nr:glycosyltransferase family 4 protein [Rhizobium sp. EC-SD404]VVT16559.1 Glycosyl transferase [Rhizobium sp. EC-SD404]